MTDFPMPRTFSKEKYNASITIRCTEDLSREINELIQDKGEKAAWLREWIEYGVKHLKVAIKG